MGQLTRHYENYRSAYSSKLLWFVLFVGVVVSIVAWRITEGFESRVNKAHFEAHALENSLLIRKQFESTTSALEDLASLYAVNNAVSGEQFSRFVTPILARQSALQALGWNPVVLHAQRDAYESAMRDAGMTGYRITERSLQGDLVTATPREKYVVVAAIEPIDGNRSALGYDTHSEATRRLAIERARDTGEPAVAAPITLVQIGAESRGALVFLPVYRRASSVATVEERRANLEGFFVAVININRTVAAALTGTDQVGMRLKLTTTAPGGTPVVLYASTETAERDAVQGLSGLATAQMNRPYYSTRFPWGGHFIDAQFVANDNYIPDSQTWAPMAALLGGLTLTLLTTAMVFLYQSRTARITQKVADRTRELEEANRVLEAEVQRRIAVETRLEAYKEDLEREVATRTSELKSTSTQLRTILESEPECVKILAADGKLEDMNAAGLAMIEADSIEQVRGADIYSLIAPEHRDAFINLNRRVIKGQSGTLEFRLSGLRGGTRWVETHAVPLVDTETGRTRHLAITRDVTAKKDSEREHAKLEGQLRHAQKLESIGVLAGGIAHDFNNLLQVIIGSNEIALQELGTDTPARRALEDSHSAAINAAKLCDQMLTYAGHSRTDPQQIHLPQLVETMVNLLGMSYSKNVSFELDLEGAPDMVEGDDGQIRQVVMNLVTNASEAIGSQPGQVVVRIRSVDVAAGNQDTNWVESAPPAGHYISLEVSDTGCGMDEQIKERMFDPFFTTKFAGRGLGLSSTLGIIRNHQGFLKVDSDTGHGTSFTILFPSSNRVSPVTPVTLQPTAMFDETILLVDDEQPVRRVGRLMLERLGCRVVVAVDGEEAVTRFAQQSDSFFAVLLDITMPKMSGNQAYVELRRIRPDIAVIFCSGYSYEAVEADTDSPGFTGFLHKPYRRDDLVRVLSEARNHAQQAAKTNLSRTD